MELHAWGANSHGQLGVGSFSEFELPQIVESAPRNIFKVICGAGHSIVVSDEDVWVTGWNNKGQLGLGSTIDVNKFQKLGFHRKFVAVSAGWDTSAGITSDNRLFVWGSNSHNQLGFSNSQYKVITQPLELKLPNCEQVSSIKFGLRHTVMLTTNNRIYIVGSLKHFKNSKHQLINHNSTEFMLIVPSGKIHHIASGQNHITFLDDDRNSIRGIGDNKFMQCSEIQPDGKIIQLLSGWTHNAFLTESKELYLFGRNNYGQLGNGSRGDCAAPQKCQIHPVDKFQLGAEHGILLSNNEVFTWGWNEHGNCGNGSVDDVLKPEKLEFINHSQKLSVIAGSGYCMVLCKS